MCGIVGILAAYANGFSEKENRIFDDMLVFNAVRGYDSTGAFVVSNTGNIDITKSVDTSSSFIWRDEYRKRFNREREDSGMFMFGHCRAATRGSITEDNAHPFIIDDKIVLMQNGTYYGSHKHLKNTDVDTEAVAHVIAEEPDVETALQRINAAYALVWYNVEKKSLNIIRNKDRPLYIGMLKTGSVLFASEPGFIQLATDRHEMPLKDKPYLLKEHVLLEYTIDPAKKNYTTNIVNIDATYQHKHTPTYSNIPSLARPTPPTKEYLPATNATHEVTRAFSGVAMTDLKDYHLNNEEKRQHKQQMMDAGVFLNKNIAFEVIDYEFANFHKDCTAWHVYAAPVLAENDDTTRVLFHWIVTHKTKDEMMHYATRCMYTGVANSLQEQEFRTAGETKYIVMSYVSQATPVMFTNSEVH